MIMMFPRPTVAFSRYFRYRFRKVANQNDCFCRQYTTQATKNRTLSVPSIEDEIAEANARQTEVVLHRTPDDRGWGVYACQSFGPGDVVMTSKPLDTYSDPGSHTIQTGWRTHVHMDLPSRFVNHICGVANVGIRPNTFGAYDFLALKDIAEEDEVLWDYECSEYSMGFFQCECGQPACRGQVSGFRDHGSQVIEAYGRAYVAPYLFMKPQ